MSTPAPDLATLFDFEGNIEPALKTLFETNISATGFHVFTTQETDEVTTPRIVLMLKMGTGTEDTHIHMDGVRYQKGFNASLSFGVITKRTGKSNQASHGYIRGRLRELMQSLTFDSDILPYHHLVKFWESGTQPQIQDENDYDVSQISFDGFIGIRLGAWPI